MVETEIVEDRNGVKKKLTGRPTGLKDYGIPTGESDLDGRCPNCGEVGLMQRSRDVTCTNMDCRVSEFIIFVRD